MGPDQIDFNFLKETFNSILKIITNWVNLCLSFKYFPLILRVGEIAYFLKQEKIASEPKSYHLICLLPTLKKFLEKLLVNRLVYFSENNKLLHNFQLGFREGSSCELALKEIMSSVDSNIDKGKYTLVLMDIKGAFDSIE